MYESGLTADGCWNELDDYAKESIERFAKLLFQKAQQEFALQELVDQAQKLGIE